MKYGQPARFRPLLGLAKQIRENYAVLYAEFQEDIRFGLCQTEDADQHRKIVLRIIYAHLCNRNTLHIGEPEAQKAYTEAMTVLEKSYVSPEDVQYVKAAFRLAGLKPEWLEAEKQHHDGSWLAEYYIDSLVLGENGHRRREAAINIGHEYERVDNDLQREIISALRYTEKYDIVPKVRKAAEQSLLQIRKTEQERIEEEAVRHG